MSATLALLDGPLDPFARTSTPGHLTASAIVLDEARERVLVVWHAGLGKWLQPGGHYEPADDSPLAAATREAEEETGVRLKSVASGARLVHVDVHAIPARGFDPAHNHHDLRFAFTLPQHLGSSRLGDATVRWMNVHELEARGADVSLCAAVASALGEKA